MPWRVNYEEIRDTLIRAREAEGLSQTQVVRRLGLTKTALSAWENGRNQPRIDDLQRWARAVRRELVVTMVEQSQDGGALAEVVAGLAGRIGLTGEQAATLVRVARLLRQLPERDERVLTAYLSALEQEALTPQATRSA